MMQNWMQIAARLESSIALWMQRKTMPASRIWLDILCVESRYRWPSYGGVIGRDWVIGCN